MAVRRWLASAVALCLVSVGVEASAGAGPATASPAATPAVAAPVVTNALTARWVLPGSNGPEGARVGAGVRLSAVEALHNVSLTVTSSGPVSLAVPARQAIGDLRVGSDPIVNVPFAVSRDGTGTVHVVVTGVTGTGTPVASADDVDFATGARRVALSLSGSLDAQSAALAFERPTIGDASYQQRLVAIQGAGATEHFVAAPLARAPALPAMTTVSGTIKYTDSGVGTHPARTLNVEIRDADGSSANGSLAGSGTTDASGKYSVSVATLRADGKTARSLFVRALAQGAGFVVKGVGAALPQHVDSSTHAAAGVPITVDLTTNHTDDNNTAFDVADTLTSAIAYTKHINGGAVFANITASFPDPNGTNFNSNNNVARILKLDRFDWDVILHEYGHFVAAQLKIDNSPGGAHSFGENLAETRGKANGILLAWSEGFATWFGITAQDVLGVSALGIPKAGDSFYDDTEDANFHVDLQTMAGFASKGEDNELSVARSLWHFYKDAKLAMADTLILSTLKSAHADTLSKAVAALLPAGGAARFDDSAAIDAGKVMHANDFACVLTDQLVAPKLTAPATGSMADAGKPSAFTWDPNGAGPSNRLNSFTVQFWSPNWDTKIFESPQQAATTYTPTMADWKDKILGGKDKNGKLPPFLNVVVKGSNTSAPATGPYKSCVITLVVSHIDLVFAIDTTGSMGPYIASTVASAQSVVNTLVTDGIDYRIGLVDYKDVDSTLPGCPPDYDAVVDLAFSNVQANIVSAIGALPGKVGGGCDIPEDVYSGVEKAIGFPWRSGVKKAIIQMGDAPGHDPEAHSGFTLARVQADAAAVDPAQVFAILVGSDPTAHAFAQALADATGGLTVDATANPSQAGPAVIDAVNKIAAAPVANAGGPYTGKVGEPIVFDASGSVAVPPAGIASYTWDFGDGSAPVTVATMTTTHTYSSAFTGTAHLKVTDTLGATGLASASVTVAGSIPPTITSADHTTFTVGVAGSFTVTTTGSPPPSVAETGTLPAGVSFVDHHDGTATLTGTPASGTAGSYDITIKAANGVSPDAAQAFHLVVVKAATTTALSATSATALFGSPVGITATVAPAAANALSPAGGVTFFLDSRPAPIAVLALAGNQAGFTTAGLGAGSHTITATYGGDTNFLPSSARALSETVTCTATLTGQQPGSVLVGPGVTCLFNVQVPGSVILRTGAVVDLEGSTISGDLTASGPGSVRLCASTTGGAVIVTSASGLVLIGDAGDDGCAVNTVGGALNLRNNTNGLDAIGNHVAGAVVVSGNSGAGAFPIDVAPEVSGNGPA